MPEPVRNCRSCRHAHTNAPDAFWIRCLRRPKAIIDGKPVYPTLDGVERLPCHRFPRDPELAGTDRADDELEGEALETWQRVRLRKMDERRAFGRWLYSLPIHERAAHLHGRPEDRKKEAIMRQFLKRAPGEV